jgi:ubiquinone/menaquinone biosynthesis C-methylase UbiE
MIDDSSATMVKQRARTEFEAWSRSYDRSWLNELIFLPTIRACQQEIAAWKRRRRRKRYRLLDVGCGTGSLLTLQAADAGAQLLVGLDYSRGMIEKFAAKIVARPEETRLHAIVGDSERLPFADATFDLLTCCHSFHHYPKQAAVVREFARVLRPGGELLLIDAFRDNVIGWLVFDVGVKLIERDVHHASWAEARQFVLNAGFAKVEQRKMNVLAPVLITRATR